METTLEMNMLLSLFGLKDNYQTFDEVPQKSEKGWKVSKRYIIESGDYFTVKVTSPFGYFSLLYKLKLTPNRIFQLDTVILE